MHVCYVNSLHAVYMNLGFQMQYHCVSKLEMISGHGGMYSILF